MAQEHLIISHIKGVADRLDSVDAKITTTREDIASLKANIEYIKSTLDRHDEDVHELEERVRVLEKEATRQKAWAAAIAALTGGGVTGLVRLFFSDGS